MGEGAGVRRSEQASPHPASHRARGRGRRRTKQASPHSPINLTLGISKILTLHLALRLFGKSINNGTTVYRSGYLRPNELLHVHHVGEDRARVEGRGARESAY